MTSTIILLPGDGVGPEVTDATIDVLNAVAEKFSIDFSFQEFAFGGAAIDSQGDPAPRETIDACLEADAIFLGAVGGPKWDGAEKRPEMGILQLRKELGVFANLRPMIVQRGLEPFSPLKETAVAGADILIVRELTGGIYFGEREEGVDVASDLCTYSCDEVLRIARIAFQAARGRKGIVTSVDKANVLATSRLWRAVVTELQQTEFQDITLHHQLVDSMAMKLITNPQDFDVVLTENMFGDILSDEASVIAGSIGLSPSASLGTDGPGLYEPIHGSAPDIAGQNKVNPIGAILSSAMMLRHSLNLEAPAKSIEDAVARALQNGLRTADIGGTVACNEAAAHIAQLI